MECNFAQAGCKYRIAKLGRRQLQFSHPSRNQLNQKTQMFRLFASPSALELGKWCAYALVLLAPGSFVIVPVVLLVRQWRSGLAQARE